MDEYFDSTHTVYFINGSLSYAQRLIQRYFPSITSTTFVYEKFGIDESRNIQVVLSQMPQAKDGVCISFSSITTEAQNSLLKILEEVEARIVFLIFPDQCHLLDTILSRGFFIKENKNIETNMLEFVNLFLNTSVNARQKILDTKIKNFETYELRLFLFTFIQCMTDLYGHERQFVKQNGKYLLHAYTHTLLPKTSPKQILEFLSVSIQK